jgi:hypothetical protein
MKRIYTYGHALQTRNQTVADKIANKARGHTMTKVTARNTEEAAIIADQGIDMIITGSDWFADVRRCAPMCAGVRPIPLSPPPFSRVGSSPGMRFCAAPSRCRYWALIRC